MTQTTNLSLITNDVDSGSSTQFLQRRLDMNNTTDSNMTKIDDWSVDVDTSLSAIHAQVNPGTTDNRILIASSEDVVASGSLISDVAPVTAPYVVLSSTGYLGNSDVLTAGDGISLSGATVSGNYIAGSGIGIETVTGTQKRIKNNIVAGSAIELYVNTSTSAVTIHGNDKMGVTMLVDGGDTAITTTSASKIATEVPYDGTITRWGLLSVDGTAGTVSVRIDKATYANFPSTWTNLGTISISSSGTKSTGTVSWSLTEGDIIKATITAVSNIKKLSITLKGIKV